MTKTYIPAKPTMYKGVQYRSRLEASWAVFWGAIKGRLYEVDINLEVSYEDFTSSDGTPFEITPCCEYEKQMLDESDWYKALNYKPDFKLHFTCNDGIEYEDVIFQEVKPKKPNWEYCRFLSIIASGIGMANYPLIMTIGGFRDDEVPSRPLFRTYPYWRTPIQLPLGMLCPLRELSSTTVNNCGEIARNFRWDLYQDEEARCGST